MSTLKTRFAVRSAKTLRSNMTDAERKLWYRLRSRRFGGFKFVRQLPVGPYFADFACRERDLIIELDGGQHSGSLSDTVPTQALKAYGYGVIRFWNNEVLTNIDGVLQEIANHLKKPPSPGLRITKPDLSPAGRGEDPSNSNGRPS